MALFFFGCHTNTHLTNYSSRSDRHSDGLSQLRSSIVSSADDKIGAPYKHGAKGPKRFDCSGLVQAVYQQHGLSINGSAQHISELGTKIDMLDARPGDLVFYKRKGKIFHVSIITKRTGAELWVVHSTSSRGVMAEDVLKSTYWRPLIHKVISLESLKR